VGRGVGRRKEYSDQARLELLNDLQEGFVADVGQMDDLIDFADDGVDGEDWE